MCRCRYQKNILNVQVCILCWGGAVRDAMLLCSGLLQYTNDDACFVQATSVFVESSPAGGIVLCVCIVARFCPLTLVRSSSSCCSAGEGRGLWRSSACSAVEFGSWHRVLIFRHALENALYCSSPPEVVPCWSLFIRCLNIAVEINGMF